MSNIVICLYNKNIKDFFVDLTVFEKYIANGEE